jgi:hypothetical protein
VSAEMADAMREALDALMGADRCVPCVSARVNHCICAWAGVCGIHGLTGG